MAMCAPARLGASGDEVSEEVGGWPGVGVVNEGVDFGVCGVVDAQAALDEGGANEGFCGRGRGGRGRGEVVAELVGEAFARVGSVGEDGGVPEVVRIGGVEFCEMVSVSQLDGGVKGGKGRGRTYDGL